MDKPKYHTNRLTIEIHEDMLPEAFRNLYYEIAAGYTRAVDFKVGRGKNDKKFIEMTLECDIMLQETAYLNLEAILQTSLSSDINDNIIPLQGFAKKLGVDYADRLDSGDLMRTIISSINKLPRKPLEEDEDD